MKKSLSLQITNFNKLIVVEQLSSTNNLTRRTEHITVTSDPCIVLNDDHIRLTTNNEDIHVAVKHFDTNQERDEYIDKIKNWISNEQFDGTHKLEIGKPCLVSDDGENWYEHIFVGKIPEKYGSELPVFVIEKNCSDADWIRWAFVKPLNDFPRASEKIYDWKI